MSSIYIHMYGSEIRKDSVYQYMQHKKISLLQNLSVKNFSFPEILLLLPALIIFG
jgi:hypothetical protein